MVDAQEQQRQEERRRYFLYVDAIANIVNGTAEDGDGSLLGELMNAIYVLRLRPGSEV